MRMRFTFVLPALVLLLLLAACSGHNDRPPDNGTPWPENLTGTFVSGDSRLVFNGDGVTVQLELSDEMAEKTGLPAGKSDGSYAFLFHNESWRYDLAEGLRITVGDISIRYITVPGSTDGQKVCFDAKDGSQLTFTKN